MCSGLDITQSVSYSREMHPNSASRSLESLCVCGGGGAPVSLGTSKMAPLFCWRNDFLDDSD